MLPSVESPVPETIGLGMIFSVAGACGMAGLFLGTILKRPSTTRDEWSSYGMALGFCFGAGFYLIALAVELL